MLCGLRKCIRLLRPADKHKTDDTECCRAYKGIAALRQDDSLLQAAHYNPPQLLEHTLQNSLLTNGGEQCQPAKHTNTFTHKWMRHMRVLRCVNPKLELVMLNNTTYNKQDIYE